MSQTTEGRSKTFPNTAALAQHRRVILSGGVLAYASAVQVELGTLDEAQFASTVAKNASVILPNAPGTTKFIANAAITAQATVYAAADGKVGATGTLPIGRAMHATAGDGEVIEVLRLQEISGEGTVQTISAAASESSTNSIVATAKAVNVTAVTVDANDFIVLPAIADVAIGEEIIITANAGSNFELRTPASSNTKINDVDSDGSQEYLVTDTDIVRVVKRTTTGWAAQSITKLGAVRTAVVPD